MHPPLSDGALSIGTFFYVDDNNKPILPEQLFRSRQLPGAA